MNPTTCSLGRSALLLTLLLAVSASGQSWLENADQVQPDQLPALITQAEQAMLTAIRDADYGRAEVIVEGARGKGLPLSNYYLLKATIARGRQDMAQEEKLLLGALHHDPTLTDVYLRLAQMRKADGLWLKATELYRQSIEANPHGLDAYIELAAVLREHERGRTAIDVLDQAGEIAPDDPHVQYALGEAHEYVGELEQARTHHRQAARAADAVLRNRALLKVGDLSIALKDPMTAVAFYRTALAGGVSVCEELYARMAAGADDAAWSLAKAAWEGFEAYLNGASQALEREEVYQVVAAALAEEHQIAAFVDAIRPPEPMRAPHASRRLQDALLCEMLVNVLSYLDTGDETLVTAARNRRSDALAQQDAIAQQRRRQSTQ